jgi:transposase
MRNKNTKNYDLEFKQSSAKLAIQSDQPISETARNLGVNPNTLHGWIKKHGNNSHRKKPVATTQIELLQQELLQSKKEISRLKQERDILKKAAAYFANEAS